MVWPFRKDKNEPFYQKGRVYRDYWGQWVGINRYGLTHYAKNWDDAMRHAMS